jgi:predicted permease
MATVIVTLALAIGANGALFSLINQLFFQAPAGVVEPGALRRLYVRSFSVGRPIMRDVFEYLEYAQLKSVLARGAQLEAYTPTDSARVAVGDASQFRRVVYATAGYFDLLGVRARRGRFFTAEEAGPRNAASVAVISDALWRNGLGADPQVIGRAMTIDDQRYTVIGVAPADFSGADLDAAELWLPLGKYARPFIGGEPWYARWRSPRSFRVLARVAPGTPDRWIATRATTARRRGGEGESRIDTTITVLTGPLSEALGPSIEPRQDVAITTRLAAVVAILLLIACANVANLLLARGIQRRRQIAVRLALGISRRRLVMQLLLESVVLAAIGGALGMAIAARGGAALRSMLMPDTHWAGAPFDIRVAMYTTAIAAVVGLLAGLAPALHASNPDLTSALKASTRDGNHQPHRLRAVLIVVQASLSVILLAGAGVFVTSLRNVKAVDLGYDADRLVFASVEYRNPECRCVDHYFGDQNAIAAGLSRAAATLGRLPIVEHAALGSAGPMYGFATTRTYRSSGDTIPALAGNEAAIVDVSPEYFATTGMRLLRGRLLSRDDDAGAPPVMVVNETLAETVWPGQDPVGQCLVLGAPAPRGRCYTVVGVVSSGHRMDVVEPPTMQYYVPLAQGISGHHTAARILILRAAPGRAAQVADRTRQFLRTIFPTAEPPRVTAMATRLAPQYRPWQLGAVVFSTFGALAMIVATLGIYSVVAFAVQQRRHELGVRMALGATPGTVLELVIGGGLRIVAIGVAAGVLLTLALSRTAEAILYQTSPRDPLVLGVVCTILLGAAALACLVPARAATRLDPAEVLRAE